MSSFTILYFSDMSRFNIKKRTACLIPTSQDVDISNLSMKQYMRSIQILKKHCGPGITEMHFVTLLPSHLFRLVAFSILIQALGQVLFRRFPQESPTGRAKIGRQLSWYFTPPLRLRDYLRLIIMWYQDNFKVFPIKPECLLEYFVQNI